MSAQRAGQASLKHQLNVTTVTSLQLTVKTVDITDNWVCQKRCLQRIGFQLFGHTLLTKYSKHILFLATSWFWHS